MSLPFLVPSPNGRRLFADGWMPRGELVRYDNQSRQFLPFLSGISASALNFSGERQVDRLRLLPRRHSVAEPR